MRVFIESREDDEVGPAVWSLPDPFARRIGEVKAAGYFDAIVKALKDRENRFDLVPDPRIVGCQPLPGNYRFVAERGARHLRDNPGLGTKLRARRDEYSARCLHYRHRILD